MLNQGMLGKELEHIRKLWPPLLGYLRLPLRFTFLGTAPEPLLLSTYGLPFCSPLLVTVPGPLLLDTNGLPFGSPLLVTVLGPLLLGSYAPALFRIFWSPFPDPFSWVHGLPFASLGHHSWTSALGYLGLSFGSPLLVATPRPLL